jgi:hypothetical protein
MAQDTVVDVNFEGEGDGCGDANSQGLGDAERVANAVIQIKR